MTSLDRISFGTIKRYVLKEKLSYKLILLYFFLEYVRPQTLYPVLEIIPWSQIILLAVPIVYFSVDGQKYNVKNLANVLLILYFLVIVLSSFTAISFDISFSKWIDFLIWVHVYFLIINIVNTESRFLVLLLTFLLYNFKMSQHSFLGWARIGFGYSNWGTGGGLGWFENSGEFGIEMCVFFPISLYFILGLSKNWPKWKKIFFYLMPATALSGMLSSTSRGAVLGGAAVLLWILLKSKYKVKSIIALVIISVVFMMVLPDEMRARFEVAGNSSDRTTHSRTDRWEKGLEMAKQRPITGVGYENWSIADRTIFGGDGHLCHNIFIQCTSELGYTGLLVFSLMIIFTFVNNFRTRRLARKNLGENRFLYNMAHGLDGALIGYLVSGFFVTVLYYPYFWINLAMTVALNNIARKKIENQQAEIRAERA